MHELKGENVARMMRSEKLREQHYREGYVRCLENKRTEWDGERNVEYMWNQIKLAVFGVAREVCGSVRVEEKNPNICGGMMW